LLALLPASDSWPTLAALCTGAAERRLPALAELTAALREAASVLSNAISARYFSHATGYQVLG
jgi:hypothetical protein